MELATAADVATALGLSSVDALPDDQTRRLPFELSRVQRAFVRAAERPFLNGPVRVQCQVVGGWITLLDTPTDTDTAPVTVADRRGNALDIKHQDGSRMRVSRYGCALPSGETVTASYTSPGVPPAVTAAVACIVARRLSVTPGSPESKFTQLTAGADFRAAGAAWVSSTAVLTPDEMEEARSYRPPAGTVIVARWNDERDEWFDGWYPGFGQYFGWGWGAAFSPFGGEAW